MRVSLVPLSTCLVLAGSMLAAALFFAPCPCALAADPAEKADSPQGGPNNHYHNSNVYYGDVYNGTVPDSGTPGSVRQWRDPATGDIVTSGTAPRQPAQSQPQTPIIISPTLDPSLYYGGGNGPYAPDARDGFRHGHGDPGGMHRHGNPHGNPGATGGMPRPYDGRGRGGRP